MRLPFAFWKGASSAPAFDWTTGLVSHWRLNEASGTRNDSHGTNHLTATNSPLGVAGKIGNACQFVRTSSQRLSVNNNSNLQTGNVDFCVSTWVKVIRVSTNNFYYLCKWGPSGGEWILGFGGVSGLLFFQVSDSLFVNATSFGAVPDNTWVFVVAWHDSTNNTINIQVNGGDVNSESTLETSVVGSSAVLNFGCLHSSAPTTLHNGQLDSVSFWKNRVLTSQERAQLYNNGTGRDYLS